MVKLEPFLRTVGGLVCVFRTLLVFVGEGQRNDTFTAPDEATAAGSTSSETQPGNAAFIL